MKRKLTTLLALVFLFSFSISASAVIAKPPSKNSKLSKITVSTPYFPSLEITMTNVPRMVGEINTGGIHQVKFYYTKDTTISFNQAVSLDAKDGSGKITVSLNAGQSFKPSAHESGTLGVDIIVSKDGSMKLINAPSFNMADGDILYWLTFIDVSRYSPKADPAYRFSDIREWQKGISPASTAKSTKGGVKISTDYNFDGKIDYSYVIPNVQKTEKVKLANASELLGKSDLIMQSIAGAELNMYTIKVGTKIGIEKSLVCALDILDYKNGKMYDNPTLSNSVDFSKIEMIHNEDHSVRGSLGNGHRVEVHGKGSYYSILQEGYYIWAPLPCVPQHFTYNSNGTFYLERNVFRYNAVVLHVVNG